MGDVKSWCVKCRENEADYEYDLIEATLIRMDYSVRIEPLSQNRALNPKMKYEYRCHIKRGLCDCCRYSIVSDMVIKDGLCTLGAIGYVILVIVVLCAGLTESLLALFLFFGFIPAAALATRIPNLLSISESIRKEVARLLPGTVFTQSEWDRMHEQYNQDIFRSGRTT